MAGIKLRVDAYTQCGTKREINQDCVGVGKWISNQKSPDQYSSFLKSDQEPHLFLIADGLGGHDDGELASHFSIGYISNEFSENKPFDINSAISSVHTKLTMDGRHSAKPMGTTIVGLILHNNEATFFNVGDSRGYMITDNLIQQFTYDDRSIYNKPNVISRCLGGGVSLPTAYTQSQNYDHTKTFLLVSDGISNWLSDKKISEIINDEHENYSKKLCLEAIKSGSSDDVSTIFIKCMGHPTPSGYL